MNATIARYVLGVASLLVIVASLAAAAVALRRRFLGTWAGPVARLAEIVIALALLEAILEVLGTVGLFRLVPVVVVSALVGVALWRRFRVSGRRSGVRRGPLWAALGACVVGAAVVAEYASPALQAYDVGVHVLDSIWYHLPLAASFAQSGHITPLRLDVEFLTGFYPSGSELLHGLGIVLLARDTLTPVLNLLAVGPLLIAAWCIGQRREAGLASVCGVALVLATPMMVFSQAGSADNDVIGVMFLLAAAAFLLWSEEQPAALVLAAVSAGLAVSIRLTLLAPVFGLTVGVLVIAPAGRRRQVAALWLGPLVVAGGYWFARNLIAVGNPVPFANIGILPSPAPPLQAHTGFALAHYLGDGSAWNHYWQPALASGLGSWWWAIVAAAVIGPLLCLLPGAGARVRMLALVALFSLAAYLVTPESAMGPDGHPVGIAYNLRYAAPGLGLAFAVLPLAPACAGVRRQLGLLAGLLAVLVVTVAEPRLWPDRHVAAALGVGLFVLAVGLAVRFRRRFPRAVALAGAALLLTAGAAAGYAWQGHYLRGRYAFRPRVSQLAHLWAWFRGVHHARVGVVGTYGGFFSYPLFGVGDSNAVQYVAHRGPHGSFTPITSCPVWRATVNSLHLRYLVTTPARDPFRPKVLSASPEFAWTATDPAARIVFRQRALRQTIAVFELRGPLDPAGCG